MLKEHRETLEEAMKRGYIMGNRSLVYVRGAFFRYCEEMKLPLIEVDTRAKSKYATIEMDMITMGHDLVEQWIRAKKWEEQAKSVIEAATGKLFVHNSSPGFFTNVKRVPLENARALAESFVILARPDWQSHAFPDFIQQPENNDLIRFHEAQRTGIAPSKRIRDMAAWRFKCWQESLKEE